MAVVSDRGCDRVRFLRSIRQSDQSADGHHLAGRRARVPATLRSAIGDSSPDTDQEGFTDNPLDDQNTVYGLTVDQKHSNNVFVTERERGLVRQLEIEPTSAGTLTYRVVRTFLFDTSFDLKDSKGGRYSWTPCHVKSRSPKVFDVTCDRETMSLKARRLNSLPSVTSISSSLFARSVRRITRFLTMTSSNAVRLRGASCGGASGRSRIECQCRRVHRSRSR